MNRSNPFPGSKRLPTFTPEQQARSCENFAMNERDPEVRAFYLERAAKLRSGEITGHEK